MLHRTLFLLTLLAFLPATAPAQTANTASYTSEELIGRVIQVDGGKTVLTLIPQPLLRHEAADDGVVDGAVFSLAMGTDPEILLVIQCKRADDGSSTYQYAPFRANYLGLTLELKGREVWNAPLEVAYRQTRAGDSPWSSGPFFPMTPKQPLPPAEVAVVFAMGAHVIKVALNPIVIDLMERGIISAVAMNGAGIIHDAELAMAGKTSEDVSTSLGDGSFGMAEETAEFLSTAIKNAEAESMGSMGERAQRNEL